MNLDESSRNLTFWNIRRIMIGVVGLLSALFVFPASIKLYDAYRDLEQTRLTAQLMQAGIHLFNSVRNFGYERGRTNVVLNHAGPLGEMTANREFIHQRRQEGERELSQALAIMHQVQLDGKGEAFAGLNQSRFKIFPLRQKADAQMLVPKGQRDPGFAPAWFEAATGMIGSIQNMLGIVCAKMARLDGPTVSLAYLMLSSVGMRDQCAPEMALLSGVMLSGKPITEDVRLKIILHRGRSQQLLRELKALSTTLEEPKLVKEVESFDRLYTERYLPLGHSVLLAAVAGGPFPVSQKEFLATGVQALEGLVKLMGAIAQTGAAHALQLENQAKARFIYNLALLLAGMVLLTLVVTLTISRVINPLASLAQATQRIADRDLDFEVPHQSRNDEIGAVAQAVQVLQQNTAKMINDYELLEESKREVEDALAEVRTLRGLLPICSNCKKIRDDQGYWNQLEVYITHHTDAQFSHGLCPECAKKLYPELTITKS